MDDEGSSTIAIGIEAPGWADALPDAAVLCRRAVLATLDQVRAPAWVRAAGLSVLLADDATLRTLNAAWRGHDRPTNVLSFPSFELDPQRLPQRPPMSDVPLGDLALAYETLAREAAGDGKRLSDHLVHLVVHGTLHLLGHDHEEAAAAAIMEPLEITILSRLGVPDPYADDPLSPALEASS